MTPQEICERLKAEFPGIYTSFDVDCHSHSEGSTALQVRIYSPDSGHIDCTSVTEGIHLLHVKLGHVVDPCVGADVEVPA